MLSGGFQEIKNTDRTNWFYKDFMGVNTALYEIQADIPEKVDKPSFSVGVIMGADKDSRFLWNGIDWKYEYIVTRSLFIFASLLIVWIASLLFDRFKHNNKSLFRFNIKKEAEKEVEYVAPHWKPMPNATINFNVLKMLLAELRIFWFSGSILWKLLTAGLLAATIFTPLETSKNAILPLLILSQAFILSRLYIRDELSNTLGILISGLGASRLIVFRFLAGYFFIMILTLPYVVRQVMNDNFVSIINIASGAAFFSSLAVFSGKIFKGPKVFEVFLTIWTYMMLNKTPLLDVFYLTEKSTWSNLYSIILATIFIMVCMQEQIMAIFKTSTENKG